MEPDIKISAGVEVSEQSTQKALEDFEEFLYCIKELAEKTWSAAGEEARAYATDAAFYLQEGFDGSKAAVKTALKDAVKGSLGPLFEGEMGDVEEVWEKAWLRMGDSLDSIWQGLLGQLESRIWTGLENIAEKMLYGPIESMFGEMLGGNSYISDFIAALGMGDSFNEALEAADIIGGDTALLGNLGELFGDSAGNVASIAGAAKTVAGWLGLGETAAQTTTTYMSWAAQDAAATAAYLESIAPAADFAAINAEIGAAGVESAAAAGEAAGAAYGSAFAGAAAIGGAIAAGELLALATGGVGPTEAFATSIGSFFGERGEGFTPQKAQEFIQADYEYLGRALADTDRLNLSLDDIQEAVLEMEKLQEVAGLSDEQLQAMFASLGSVGQAMVEAAEVGTLLNDQALNLVATYDMEVETLNNREEATRNLTSGLYDLASQISDASGGVIELGAEFAILGDEFVNGEMSGDKLAEALENSINAALQNATKQGKLTAEQMRDLGEQIRAIPTEWVSDVYVNVYERYHDSSEKHSGGLVMHTGGRVPGRDLPGYWAAHERYHGGAVVRTLAPDEVPIIAQRGEFVVRKSSVNSETLPLLKALNQSGQAASAGPALNIQNLVNIEGNLIGNQESFEDLVREIEAKLREVAGSRRAA